MIRKKPLILFLALLVCLFSVIPIYGSTSQAYVQDHTGVLTSEEKSHLEEKAADIYQTYGIRVFTSITDDAGEQGITSYAASFYRGLRNAKDSIILVHDNGTNQIYLYTGGKADQLFTENNLNKIYKAYSDEEYYSEAVDAFLNETSRLMKVKGVKPAAKKEHGARVIDEGSLLTSDEIKNLKTQLDEISKRQQCDVVIVTVDSLGEKTSTEYADNYYDDNGYGIGEGDDGILLLVSMEERDWAISTYGYGITAFTDAGQAYIMEEVQQKLSDGAYFEAFQSFASQCDDFLTEAKEDTPYDSNNLPKGKPPLVWIPIALLVGIVIALVSTGVMKGKLKSVRKQPSAANYEKHDSFRVTDQRDIFLYNHIERRAKPKENNSGSGGSGSHGSSKHTSSSGRSHGGSSGKF